MTRETAVEMLELPFRLPLTAEEFEKVPPIEGFRVELWEGNLDLAARAQLAWHSAVIRRIANMLEAAGRVVSVETGVIVAPRTVREPDVTRFRRGFELDLNRSQFRAVDVDLVVEVVSAESEKRDRQVKPDEYAKAAIPEFWLVARDPEAPHDALIKAYGMTPRRIRHARDGVPGCE